MQMEKTDTWKEFERVVNKSDLILLLFYLIYNKLNHRSITVNHFL